MRENSSVYIESRVLFIIGFNEDQISIDAAVAHEHDYFDW